jgi:hypothetical protein
MNLVVLDLYPVPQWIEIGGQIAAIVILLFLSLLIVLSVALNLIMAFVSSWLRDKSELIKKLRPPIEAVNQASEAALRGEPPAEEAHAAVKIAATIPVQVRKADEKVEQVGERVANGVIEFRARTTQARAIAKAFLMPGLLARELRARRRHQEFAVEQPGLSEVLPEEPPTEQLAQPVAEEYAQTIASSQAKHVSAR